MVTQTHPIVSEPRVLQGLGGSLPLRRLKHQQLLDEVFSILRNVLKVGEVEGVVAG